MDALISALHNVFARFKKTPWGVAYGEHGRYRSEEANRNDLLDYFASKWRIFGGITDHFIFKINCETISEDGSYLSQEKR